MKHHGAAISVAAKDWVDRYKAGRAAATAELLTFLLQARCSSCMPALLCACMLPSWERQQLAARCRPCGRKVQAPAMPPLLCRCISGLQARPGSRGPARPASPAAQPRPCLPAALQSCGVDTVLSEEAVEEGEVDALRQELDAQAQEVRPCASFAAASVDHPCWHSLPLLLDY